MSSTKAGVTEAPPLDTSRIDDTSVPGPSARARAMAMKKVGGPARKEMRSRCHECQRLLGVEAADQDRAQAGGARHEDPVEQPRDVGHRRRHQHRVGRAEAVHPGHQRRLPAQAALRVQHRLGDPGRARGEQDQGDVGGLAGEGAGTAPGRRRRRRRARRGRRTPRRRAPGRGRGRSGRGPPSTSAAPNECRTGAATAPMRQQARVRTAAARLLGTCQATASPRRTPRSRRPPATVATSASASAAESRVAPSTTSPPCAVSRASRVGTSQGPPGRR